MLRNLLKKRRFRNTSIPEVLRKVIKNMRFRNDFGEI
jgi:hypothetical protein